MIAIRMRVVEDALVRSQCIDLSVSTVAPRVRTCSKEDCDLEHGPDGRSTLVPRSWNARRFNRDLVWRFAHSQSPPGPVVPNQFRPLRSRMLAEVWWMFGDVRGRSRTFAELTETTFDSVSRRSCVSSSVSIMSGTLATPFCKMLRGGTWFDAHQRSGMASVSCVHTPSSRGI